jgi:hypothetical protein
MKASTGKRAHSSNLDLTLPTPQQKLACDEALLDWCEERAVQRPEEHHTGIRAFGVA